MFVPPTGDDDGGIFGGPIPSSNGTVEIITTTTTKTITATTTKQHTTDNDFHLLPPPTHIHNKYNITTIIPFCKSNRINRLEDAVNSVLQQTFPIHEIIIAIDSNPNCIESINNIWNNENDENDNNQNKPQVTIYKLPNCPTTNDTMKPKCVASKGRTRNYAMDHASPSTTHYAFLDDDDLWLPEKTSLQIIRMDQEKLQFSGSDGYYPIIENNINPRCVTTNTVGSNDNNNITNPYGTYRSLPLFSIHPSPPPSNISYHYGIWNGGKHRNIVTAKNGWKYNDPFPKIIDLNILLKHDLFITSSVIVSKELLLYAPSNDDDNKKDGEKGFKFGNERRGQDYVLWKKLFTYHRNLTAAYHSDPPLVIYDKNRWKCDDISTSSLYNGDGRNRTG